MKNIQAPKLVSRFLPIIACFLLLLPGCSNPVQRYVITEDGPVGTLLLTVSRGVERTILPEWPAESERDFRIAFTAGTGNNADSIPEHDWDGSSPIHLSAGAWAATVTALCGNGYAVASGDTDIIVPAEGTVSGSVTLFPIHGPGNGTFSWSLTFPGNVGSVEIAIEGLGASAGFTPQTLRFSEERFENTGNGRRSFVYSVPLPHGHYRVTFMLTNEREETAMVSSALHVYQDLESRFPGPYPDTFTFETHGFLASLLDIILGAWNGYEWDFANTPHGAIRPVHFSLVGISGVTETNFHANGVTGIIYWLNFYSREMEIVPTNEDALWDFVGLALDRLPTIANQLRILRNTVQDDGTYEIRVYDSEYLTSWEASLEAFANRNIRITIAGVGATTHTVQLDGLGSLFTIPSGVSLTLQHITLQGIDENNAALVIVREGGTLNMGAEVTIANNRNDTNPFNDDTWAYLGGGVHVEGTFAMSAGVISGNRAETWDGHSGGGGVFVANGGEFSMYGGRIAGNHASDWGGGGVFIDGGGSFYMHEGIIEENRATGGGGGVHVGAHDTYIGEFVIYIGGTIRLNETTGGGGGGVFVNIDDDPTRGGARGRFHMYDGNIHDNVASNNTQGGGVFTRGDFTMQDGTIFDNHANAGGGVNVGEDGEFTMEDGTISGNIAITGGGVSVGGHGEFTMEGGTIQGNTAVTGGGVNIDGYGYFTMYGGEISETNNAPVGASLFVDIGGTARYGGVFVGQFGIGNIPTTNLSLPRVIPAGTEGNPFQIFTEDQLRRVGGGIQNPAGYQHWTLSAHYVLMADINLEQNSLYWTPIGTLDAQFTGTFDGGFRTITGLRLNVTGGPTIRAGMFGFVGGDGVVRNIGLIDIDINVNTDPNTNVWIGGIVGRNGPSATVENSFVKGEIRGAGTIIVGDIGMSVIRQIGGIVGSNQGTVRNTHSDVYITVVNAQFVGGLVGNTDPSSTVENSFATGAINTAAAAGGLVGLHHGILQNSVALNPSISGTGNPSRNRVIGSCGGGPAISNHARIDMLVNGALVTTVVGVDTLHGADITEVQWNDAAAYWWEEQGFDGGHWRTFQTAGLPILRGFADGVHNPTVHNLPTQ